ncbi:hypothetical protein VNO80_04081 [Phaseolus coccineus]|uniref:Uncharacterized protein n=1 Tax=Phaseolus coccineus TaxID=3886 RepID=A0AAN9RJE4_PHACN
MASNRGQSRIQQLLAAEQEAQRLSMLRRMSSGDPGANVKRLEVDTGAKIHHLKTEAGMVSGDVVTLLLKLLRRITLTVCIEESWNQ